LPPPFSLAFATLLAAAITLRHAMDIIICYAIDYFMPLLPLPPAAMPLFFRLRHFADDTMLRLFRQR
jgi:hypothetical protein